METRVEKLMKLSQLVMDNTISYKVDFIGSIAINDRPYFNVYRRYNSQYNIIVEDVNGDIYLQQDYNIRQSMKKILCLNDTDTKNMRSKKVYSYRHNGEIPSSSNDVLDMNWTTVNSVYCAVLIDVTGIFKDNVTDANTLEVADILVSMSKYDTKKTLSDQFKENNIKQECVCSMNTDMDEEYLSDIEDNLSTDNNIYDTYDTYDTHNKISMDNYIELRSGLLVPKKHS